MLVLEQTLWIIATLYIDSLLPQGCKATIETKKIWMDDDEDSHARFVSKPARRLLDSRGDYEKPPSYHRSNTDNSAVIYVFVTIFFVILVAIIKCCIKFASEPDEEITSRIVHPPPNRTYLQPSSRSYAGSRPLAPPMTSSRSVILSPEERDYQTFFTGLENPTYIPSTTIDQLRRNSNPVPLLDLPPAYDTVVTEDGSRYPKSDESDLPKYDFS